MTEDPGPVPERGLMVRAQGDGFYARVWPRPVMPWGRFSAWVGGLTAVGAALASAIAADGWVAAEIVGAVGLFAALLFALSHGQGYVPVEITVDDERVVWGGERIPLAQVADCRLQERTLRLVAADGRVLAELDGILPDAGRWLALAIRASLPR